MKSSAEAAGVQAPIFKDRARHQTTETPPFQGPELLSRKLVVPLAVQDLRDDVHPDALDPHLLVVRRGLDVFVPFGNGQLLICPEAYGQFRKVLGHKLWIHARVQRNKHLGENGH